MICVLSLYSALLTVYSVSTSFVLIKIGKSLKQKKEDHHEIEDMNTEKEEHHEIEDMNIESNKTESV